jgi:ATP/maltotriose-dependent transcriptional regulator MalT
VLVATGDWAQAEEELETAIEVSRVALSGLHAQALACFAELRLAQGRLEEAERLVAGLDDHPDAAATLARTHLVRERPTAAATILRRSLDAVGEDRVQAVVLREPPGMETLRRTYCARSGSAQPGPRPGAPHR